MRPLYNFQFKPCGLWNQSHPLEIESPNAHSVSAMPASKRPLSVRDFPVQKVDEAKREEDKVSA
jgi:hypothetical protein